MRDALGVTAAREAMAKWYGPYTDEELTAGLSELTLAPGSEEAFALLRRHGVVTAIVSITWSFASSGSRDGWEPTTFTARD